MMWYHHVIPLSCPLDSHAFPCDIIAYIIVWSAITWSWKAESVKKCGGVKVVVSDEGEEEEDREEEEEEEEEYQGSKMTSCFFVAIFADRFSDKISIRIHF